MKQTRTTPPERPCLLWPICAIHSALAVPIYLARTAAETWRYVPPSTLSVALWIALGFLIGRQPHSDRRHETLTAMADQLIADLPAELEHSALVVNARRRHRVSMTIEQLPAFVLGPAQVVDVTEFARARLGSRHAMSASMHSRYCRTVNAGDSCFRGAW